MVQGLVSWHTLGLLILIDHQVSTELYLCVVLESLWLHCTHLLKAASSRITHHVRKRQWVRCTQMTSTVPRSQSSTVPFRCGGAGDSHHGCAVPVQCNHVSINSIFWAMFPAPSWIWVIKNQGRIQPSTNKVYLMKCPDSVHCHLIKSIW